ncbi:hypothetical protein [Streptomyces boncukensis]|uniref:hypothetical protein n=1 Tax=Streptomyces boncukensis TaxID=2711219 RepID=UPI0013EC758F|nr:hypothetical protein [Streptomyces boncukensis]
MPQAMMIGGQMVRECRSGTQIAMAVQLIVVAAAAISHSHTAGASASTVVFRFGEFFAEIPNMWNPSVRWSIHKFAVAADFMS